MKNLLKKGSTITIANAAKTVSEAPECTNCCFKMSSLSGNRLLNNNSLKSHQNHQSSHQNQALLPISLVENGNKHNVKKTKRKDSSEIRNFYKRLLKDHKGLLVIGAVGVLLVAVGVMVLLLDPLELVTSTMLTFTEGSYLYRIWQKPPIMVHVKVYIFNVTNADEFLRGGAKLKLQELGPFVFRETLEHHNVTFNDNNTATYTPKRHIEEIPHLSMKGVNMKSRIIVPNIPLIGFASMLAGSSYLVNLALISLTNYLDMKPFLNLTVEEYLWGYDEPLVEFASVIVPNWITFNKLGLLDRMFDDGTNIVTINLDNKVKVNKEGRHINPVTIDQYNGSPGMQHWGYVEQDNKTHKSCNTLQGLASEGVFFQRGISRNDTFTVYRKAFCRTLRIVYDHDGRVNNIPAYWYKLPDDVFDNTRPENGCYCQPDKGPCLPRGLSDLTPCYYNIPAAVSFPHFYNSDPALLEHIEGLDPNKEAHATEVVMQPSIGIPIRVHSRIQTNIVVKDMKYHKRVLPFSNITVPIFWVDLCLDEMPTSIYTILQLLLVYAPVVQTTAIIALTLAGGTLVVLSISRYLCTVPTHKTQVVQPWPQDYTAVRIAPSDRTRGGGDRTT